MQRSRYDIIIKSQTGLGYVAILVLLAILSTMGLAFIYKVGLMSSVTLNRRTSMQAHYLAESAANHALWRMLNDPGFAPASDKYYMHSLGDGRYGYKVRKPTETTFATAATVGAMGDIVTQQSYVQYIIPYDIITAYSRLSDQVPDYRRLIGAQWSEAADTLSVGSAPVTWVEVEGCPVRKEIIMGTINDTNDINLAVWDGSSWGNSLTFSTDVDNNYKCFDIAYESQSGDALVVGRTDATPTVSYNIWDGVAWVHAGSQPAFTTEGGQIGLIAMASCPGNDDILIAAVDTHNDLRVVHWDGDAFHDLGKIEDATEGTNHGIAEIVYERNSGDALVIYGARGTARYRVWNGATLGPEGTVTGFDQDVFFLRSEPDPASDQILVAGADKFNDLQVTLWDGDNWVDAREVETGLIGSNYQAVDVAWEPTGDQAIVTWAPFGDYQFRYLVWQKGTALADPPIVAGPDCQNVPRIMRLLPIAETEKIIVLLRNNSEELRYSLWDADIMRADPPVLLDASMSSGNYRDFDLAEADVPITGGTGTGVGGNLAPVVDAGPDQTLIFPTMETSLDGTVTDDGLPNPPATVTTTWTLVSGPGTVVFGDASQEDTKIKVSDPGTYVFRLTADDSELSDFDEVTIIISKSCAVLFVVPDALNLGSLDIARKALMESWGFAVAPFTAAEPQGEYDLAVSNVDVVYVSSTVYYADVTSKLKWQPVGVVNEVSALAAYLGFTSGSSGTSGTQTAIVDNTHEITSPFSTGNLTITSSTQSLHRFVNTMGPGFQTLSTTTWSSDPMLMTLETGGGLLWGGNAPARRVMLPWGSSTFDISALNSDGQEILKRAIEWAAEGACNGVVSCSADYTPDTKVGEFSTGAYGSGSIEGVSYLPEGTSFKLIGVPAGGALISVDMGDMLYVTDLAGNLLTGLALPSGTPTGVTLVPTGTWANHIAVSDKFSDEIKYFDLSGNLVSSFSTNVSADFNGTTPEDVAFIGTTASGTYNNHLAIPDLGRDKVFLVDQNGNWVSSIDILGIMANVKDAAHLPGTDKLLLVDSGGQAFIVDFLGNLLNQYDTASFGTGAPNAVTINSLTCDHLVGDATSDLIVTLNLLGGSGDTEPPTPDPMTWASPPAADGPNSIRMTATAASDPSGVEYYFECTEGGGNDSGWQDSATYIDTGLPPQTKSAYRVKARDKSANQNETGWSTEASATTTSNVMYVQDIAMGYRSQGKTYYGQATVWIRSEDGINISGAIVSATWSGSVSGTSMGTTGSDGKVMLESPGSKGGGVYKFTVTNVTKLGYVYNSSLNVETEDAITAP